MSQNKYLDGVKTGAGGGGNGMTFGSGLTLNRFPRLSGGRWEAEAEAEVPWDLSVVEGRKAIVLRLVVRKGGCRVVGSRLAMESEEVEDVRVVVPSSEEMSSSSSSS